MSDEKKVAVAAKPAAPGLIGATSKFATNAQARPTSEGDRKSVPANSADRIMTSESKDRSDADQPKLADLLASSRKIEAAQVAAAKKAAK